MTTRQPPPPPRDGREPWRVRIRRGGSGPVLGAGVLVDRTHVLTCAHVVTGHEDLMADLVGVEGTPSSPARVITGLSVPPGEDGRGDVALLRLEVAQPPGRAATLRRVALTFDRHVHVLGHPQGLDVGVWTRQTLFGHSGAEWLQMNPRSPTEQPVRVGFSGAGVADSATGDVLGIVVARYGGTSAGLSWMIPVDVVAAHLPPVARWIVGDTGIDPLFTGVRGEPAGAVAELADWLRRRHRGAAVLVVLGDELDAVRQAVAVSSGRTEAGDAPGVDLALDVGGRTVDEVSARIVSRAGLAVHAAESASERLRAGAPPMTIVLDGVDEAEQPRALVDEVIRPVLRAGGRLVLGFRRDGPEGLEAARGLVAESVATVVEAYADRIAALPDNAEWLLRLTALRRAAGLDPAAVARRLGDFERRLARAERRVGRARAIADDRGLLDVLRTVANEHGLAEDLALGEAYRRADAAALDGDRSTTHAAVRAYQDAVRRAVEEKGTT
ncbi:serine protease [Actinosynnema sp. NPDC023587]|uniref:S1 family peptidase n=1 Tax=Actinosynnema sp. NPDC023587 TaxID=3154695 RepID=UPI003409E3B9